MTFPIKKRTNTKLFIDGTAVLYMLETWIRNDQEKGSTSGTSWLERQVYLALKICENERSGGSLSQNDFYGNVKEAEHFRQITVKMKIKYMIV